MRIFDKYYIREVEVIVKVNVKSEITIIEDIALILLKEFILRYP